MGRAVELKYGLGRNSTHVVAELPHGGASQQWQIVGGDEYYTILNHASGTVLDLEWNGRHPGNAVRGSKPLKDSILYEWEFLIPVVAVPPGWIEIQSVTAGKALCHNYLSSLVTLSAPSTTSSENRDSWGSQWCFVAPSESNGEECWLLKNRLTGGFLEGETQPTAKFTRDTGEQWCVEITAEGMWRLVKRSINVELGHVGGKSSDAIDVVWSRPWDIATHWLIKQVGKGAMRQIPEIRELEGNGRRGGSKSSEHLDENNPSGSGS